MEWISVKDRLPKYEEDVLIYISRIYKDDQTNENSGIIEQKNVIQIGKRVLEDKKGNLWKISIWDEREKRYRLEYLVTHWMNLPDPPKH